MNSITDLLDLEDANISISSIDIEVFDPVPPASSKLQFIAVQNVIIRILVIIVPIIFRPSTWKINEFGRIFDQNGIRQFQILVCHLIPIHKQTLFPLRMTIENKHILHARHYNDLIGSSFFIDLIHIKFVLFSLFHNRVLNLIYNFDYTTFL